MEIGRGGFSVVNVIESIDLQEVNDTSASDAESRSRATLALSCVNADTGLYRYVIKTLRNDLPEDEYSKGIVDLAVEARFLSMLSHPNIITMRATAVTDPLESRFFVILDMLTTTLDIRLQEWRRGVGSAMGLWLGPCLGHLCANKDVLQRLWIDRLFVARDIASAIDYLHQQNIVYRDLKPENVGFDEEGDLKLFDFGLAKRLHPDDRLEHGLYSLTGNTGSLRYMAPETALGQPYDQRVDTYSFGVLFWQICALAIPYSGYTCKMHSDLVVHKGFRPKPDGSWPIPWTDLMRRCWDATIQARPSFTEILDVLDAEIEEMLSDGSEDGSGYNGAVSLSPRRMELIHARKTKSLCLKTSAAKSIDAKKLDVDTRNLISNGGDREGLVTPPHDLI